ncbi:protein PTST homolog 2, chloroplastic isoform X2 [Andrographis paniculata]|uniref:protein PTST homolog 2, chloroplastic isoform X2 n=1 Tax=Andrographis paniculata TaxID=175694 RepID=UPI0021E6FA06|nr:protein PTST homolog 2, chloroplastic isoform X2 [Andrographis paniculata]
MLSIITTHTHIPNFHPNRLSCALTFPRIFVFASQNRTANSKKISILSRYLGFQGLRGAGRLERNFDCPWCCGCKPTEEESELESQIMEFMERSEKPTMFPTKDELIQAGRMDLVDAIRTRGGWYSLGWDDDVDEGNDFDVEEFQRRVADCTDSSRDDSFSGFEKGNDFADLESQQSTASTSLESSADEDAGIEGILSRLEKQRNSDFGINVDANGYEAHGESKEEGEDRPFESLLNVGGNGKLPRLGGANASILRSSPNAEQETWRTWSYQRAGTKYAEFEAGEVSFGKNQVETDKGTYHDRIAVSTGDNAQDWRKHEDINNGQIRNHLQHLEAELASALHSLRSKREQGGLEEASGSSYSDFQKLSDAVEFQENEFMTAKERLRSIRAKLVVLEGKMAIAIGDAQRLVELKQKRMDDAHKALQLLRTTSIVWPNSASEVFLAGSFDGWTSQRKMEKSKTGIFSVNLKLYPGQYEIKFIVDGIWKVDPLRPIVYNNGYENNLLIVT